MKLKITHRTSYAYDREVSFSPHFIYMRPRDSAFLKVEDFRLEISPVAKIRWSRDHSDNLLASVYFQERSAGLDIFTQSVVETFESNPFDFILKPSAATFPFVYDDLHGVTLASYVLQPFGDSQNILRNWLDEHFVDRPSETLPYLAALNTLIHQTHRYVRRDEHGIQSAKTTLGLGSGSCRDYALLLVELCRMLGLAARFVSGYHYDPATDSPSAGAMHAWAEVYLPGAGWKGLDPTNGIFCDDGFVPVAHAAIAESVSPVQGLYFSDIPASSVLTHSVSVEKI